jgi:hypothetical protein
MMTQSLEPPGLVPTRCLTPLQQTAKFATFRFVARRGVAPSAEPKRKQKDQITAGAPNCAAAKGTFSWFALNSHR